MMSCIAVVFSHFHVPEYKKYTMKTYRDRVLQGAIFDAFYNRPSVVHQLKLRKSGVDTGMGIERYDPFHSQLSRSSRVKGHRRTALFTILCSPVALVTFGLSLISEMVRHWYAQEESIAAGICHYLIVAPIRTLWSLTVEPLTKLTIWGRDGAFYHCNRGNILKAMGFTALLVIGAILSWGALLAAAGVAPILGVAASLGSIKIFHSLAVAWQHSIGALCRGVMRWFGGVSSGLMRVVTGTAPYVALAATSVNTATILMSHKQSKEHTVKTLSPMAGVADVRARQRGPVQEWG
jgi:hypothetical protein